MLLEKVQHELRIKGWVNYSIEKNLFIELKEYLENHAYLSTIMQAKV